MSSYPREKLDTIYPVIPPLLDITLITARNISFSLPILSFTINGSESGSSFSVLSVADAISGTLLITINKIRSIEVELTSSDISSTSSVATKIYSILNSLFGYNSYINGSEVSFSVIHDTSTFLDSNISPVPYLTTINGDTIEVVPKDDLKYSEDPILANSLEIEVIKSQKDIPSAQEPFTWYHSVLKTLFYKELSDELTISLQDLIYYCSYLKNSNNVDFFSGNKSEYLDRVNNLLRLLDSKVSNQFDAMVNAENAGIISSEATNSFYRRLVKTSGLRRKWAGSSYGYSLPFKILNRLGATQIIASFPPNVNLTVNKNRVFRFIDPSEFSKLAQSINSPTIDGVPSSSDIVLPKISWDTGLFWDQNFVQTPSMFPGNINVDFGEFTLVVGPTPNKYSISVLSVANANSGQFVFLKKTLNIANSDIVSISSFIAKVVSQTYTGWTVTYSGSDIIVTSTASSSLSFDSTIQIDYTNLNIALELSLDRLLYHVNNVGTRESLNDIGFLETTSIISEEIRGGRSSPTIGTQLSLSTSSDGKFNKLSTTGYTHPNIKAKFQVFKYQPGFQENAWTGVANAQWIKLGTGGYRVSSIDDYVFVPYSMSANDSSRIVLSNLISPLFVSPLTSLEKGTISEGEYISTLIKPISIDKVSQSYDLTISHSNNSYPYIFSSKIDLVNRGIGEGSCSVGINIFWNSPSIDNEDLHQRVFMYEKKNVLNNKYDAEWSYQEQDNFGNYNNISLDAIPMGYSSDIFYTGQSLSYFPTKQKQTVLLENLIEEDRYSFITSDRILNLNFDISTNSEVKDMILYNGALSTYTASITGGTVATGSGISSKYVTLTSNANGVLVTDTENRFGSLSNFTISLAIKPDTFGGTAKIIDLGYWTLSYSQSGSVETYQIQNLTSGTNGSWTYTDTKVSSWKTLTLSVSENSFRPYFYINGVEKLPTSATNYTGTISFATVNPKFGTTYVGSIGEIYVYSKCLRSYQVNRLNQIILIRKNSLLSSSNKPIQFWIDREDGKVICKLRWSPEGVYASSNLDGTYQLYNTEVILSYKTGFSEALVGITEMGIFDSNDTMIAYATFPPIIYDQKKNHLSLNLAFSQ